MYKPHLKKEEIEPFLVSAAPIPSACIKRKSKLILFSDFCLKYERKKLGKVFLNKIFCLFFQKWGLLPFSFSFALPFQKNLKRNAHPFFPSPLFLNPKRKREKDEKKPVQFRFLRLRRIPPNRPFKNTVLHFPFFSSSSSSFSIVCFSSF